MMFKHYFKVECLSLLRYPIESIKVYSATYDVAVYM